MYRTQIQLREDQSKKLKELAAEYNVSVAELIRQSVDMFIQSGSELTQEEKRKRALEIIGLGDSGLDDLSINHDKYLAEIYSEVGT
jgi:hypothetical protein